MSQLQKFQDQFVLLLEAGFIAVNQYDEVSAKKLFDAAALLKPENSLPKVGMGYMHFLKLELNEACKTFEAVLEKEPNNEMAKTFLGLALCMTPTGVGKAEKILSETTTKTKDKSVKKLASDTLDFIEKFVKKATSPMHSKKK